MNAAAPIRVLVVDDSAVMRRVFSLALAQDPAIEVVGTAPDPFVARDLIVQLQPDVLTLDLEMPRMDGLTFLRKLMQHYPLPVVIVSSLTREGGRLAMEAIEAGAVEVLHKPAGSEAVEQLASRLAETIKVAATATPRARRAPAPGPRLSAAGAHRLVALGASTGGTTALQSILAALPAEAPPIVVVQHMPEQFTSAFAERLNGLCALEVKQAEDGEPLAAGRVLIAPGDRHLLVRKSARGYQAEVKHGPLVNRHRPSVDVLFRSLAQAAGGAAVGALLTGMGSDGAAGLLELRRRGAATLAQDQTSCVVYGMPRAAVELGAAEVVEPLDRIAGTLLRLAARPAGAPAG